MGGVPGLFTDNLGQEAAPCFGPAAPCGLGAPTDLNQDGAEAFYWSGVASVPVDGGSIDISFDVEASNAAGAVTSFQRIQVGSKDAGLPNGTYTFATPFGTVVADKTADGNRWTRLESASGSIGQIDHFLTVEGAPAGYYGDADGAPAPIVGGATAGTVTVSGPNLISGSTADWVIAGRISGTPVEPPPPPPADADGDGVPNNQDLCPTDSGPASNRGCPVAAPPAGGGATAAPTAGAGNTTIIQVIQQPGAQVKGITVSSPLAVSNLSLSRRISISRLRLQGLRTSMRVQEGTNVVRIAIYKARNGRKTGRAIYTTTRSPHAAGRFVVTLRSSKLARLRAGAYVMEVRAGASASTLGSARRITFAVTR